MNEALDMTNSVVGPWVARNVQPRHVLKKLLPHLLFFRVLETIERRRYRLAGLGCRYEHCRAEYYLSAEAVR